MGLYRTALRVATLEALRPTGLLNTQGPWPTLACDRVFDSRIDPIEDLTKEQHRAVIAVYTDGDIGYGSQHRGGPPFRRVVDLCFEISQIASAPSEADPAVYVTGVPQTDPELEAELDRIESEIALALFFAPSGAIWRKLTGSMVTDPRTTPHRDSEEGARLALRSLIWKVQVPDDRFEALPLTAPVGIDRLPEPLRSVAGQLLATSYGASLAAALGETMPTMPLAVPLTDVTLGGEIVRKGGTATGTPNVNGDVTLDGIGPPPSPPPTDSNP
jgi:hypothetical protein